VAYLLWPKIQSVKSSNAPLAGGGKAGPGPPSVPVVTTKSRKGDIGVYFTGLGAVTSINTVTVKSRIGGQLMSVQYKILTTA
jgi:hypothetical protein